ncbi:MFS transporter [Streptomyces sp. NBC_00038]|uniref:MFS transporter n=1 Tax=Streptomyces sp. NBC_00038 TaxID=2903615 RepID=UPI0022535DFF|nr:MFS transporter [Streptomyces sp. NBC_00038]MCX5562854.1 MFS transporter [Streptomyces sp. NBC_00038]
MCAHDDRTSSTSEAKDGTGDVSRDRLQRRTVRTLALTQIVAGVGVATGFGVATLMAVELAGTPELVGLELTASTLGSAAAAAILAAVAHQYGRRRALMSGYLVGAVGAAVCVAAALSSNFWLFVLGMILYGSAQVAGLQARFAAGDLAAESERGRAVSFVLWASTIGSIAGPNLSGVAAAVDDTLDIPDLSGNFLFALVGFLIAVGMIGIWLRPDPLLRSREGLEPPGERQKPRRIAPLSTFAAPDARLSLVALSTSHLVMVSLMAMTMLHISHSGMSMGWVGLAFSLHLAGMSGFSPVFGWLADVIGRPSTLVVGLLLSLVSLLVLGTSPATVSWSSATGLLLLGLGWSCVMVTGSVLLSESVTTEHRLLAQGGSDTLMLLCGALGSACSGVIVGNFGFPTLNVIAAVVVLPALLLALSSVRRSRQGEGGKSAAVKAAA